MIRAAVINDSNHPVRVFSVGFHCTDGRVAVLFELRPIDQHEIASRDSKSFFFPIDEKQAREAEFVLPLRVEATTSTGLTFDSGRPRAGPAGPSTGSRTGRGDAWRPRPN